VARRLAENDHRLNFSSIRQRPFVTSQGLEILASLFHIFQDRDSGTSAAATAGIGSLEEAANAAAESAALRRRDYEAVGKAYAEKSAGHTVAR
jgi:hypothetical protein